MLKMKSLHSKSNKVNGIKKVVEYPQAMVQVPPKNKTKTNSNVNQTPVLETVENFNSRQLLKVLMEVKNGNFGVRMRLWACRRF